MTSVYLLKPNEDWIVDRLVREWTESNSDITVSDPHSADVIWLFADWCWKSIDPRLLMSKKVITTIHHVVPEKFGEHEKYDFYLRDKITDVYHVPNEHTGEFVSGFTKKPIVVIPYWANQEIWRKTGDKQSLRKKYELPVEKYIIGSFQRDTEGSDLVSPKLEKGPDLLCDFIEKVNHEKSIHVVLAGWRRQYVISRLVSDNISFSYFEKPDHEVINELYQTLDLYPVTARYEGGPQSLIECGLLNVPVVSRAIGIAEQVLPSASISDDVYNALPSVPNVEDWKLPFGYSMYRDLIRIQGENDVSR